MSRKPIVNLAASVHRRLLNEARSSGRPFNEVLQHYAMGRFMSRLSRSRHADRFVLKGGLLMVALVREGPRDRKRPEYGNLAVGIPSFAIFAVATNIATHKAAVT